MKHADLAMEYVKVDELTPYEHNARLHGDIDVEQIAKSITKYGFNDPIGVYGKDNIIVEGHGRLMAAKRLNMETVPIIHLDHLSDEERREYAILHNWTAEQSKWDFKELEEELKELDFDDFELGFEFEEETEDAVDDDFEIEVPEEPTSKLGQIYQLGRHRLMVGDSTKLEDVSRLCNGQLVDMLLTDPPYGVSYESNGAKNKMTIQNDSLEGKEFVDFLFNAFKAADENMKPGAVFYIWHADAKAWYFREACRLLGWEVRQCIIWAKNSMVLGRQDYQWMHEPCLYGWKEGASHLWASDRKQTTIMNFDKPKRNDMHPTMKPVPLFDYQMKNNTKGGDIVLDLFGGSGTTMIAAEQNGRTAYLMEYDPKYADVIIKRWETLTGEKAVLVD